MLRSVGKAGKTAYRPRFPKPPRGGCLNAGDVDGAWAFLIGGGGAFGLPRLRRGMASPLAAGGRAGSVRVGDVGQLAHKRARAAQALDAILPLGPEDELVVRLQLHSRAVVMHEFHEALRVRELLVAERDHRALRPGVDLLDCALRQ